MKSLIFWLVMTSLLLTSCSGDDLLSRDPTLFIEKKIESPFFGSKEAKTQVVMFTDFQCPACIRFEKTITKDLFEKYVATNKIGLTYIMFPLPIHKNAPEDALAALCASAQGKYKDYAQWLYALEEAKEWQKITSQEREDMAKVTGVDVFSFQKCVNEGHYISKIKQDITLGNELEVPGTPSIYINNQLIRYSSKEEFFKIIDSLLLEKSAEDK